MKTLTKVALSALSLASVAAISVAGTFAYMKDAESKMNLVVAGEAVDIAINEYQRNDAGTALEEFEQSKKLYPINGSAQGEKDDWGMPVAENYGDKIVTVTNTGDADAQVRVFVAKPLALNDLAKNGNGNTSDDALHSNIGNRVDLTGKGALNDISVSATLDAWGWDYANAVDFEATIDGEKYLVTAYTLKGVLKPDEESSAVLAGVYLDDGVDYDDGIYTMTTDDGKTYVIPYDFTEGVIIPVYAEAIGVGMEFENAATAFQAWADSVDMAPAAMITEGTVELNEVIILADNGDATDCVTADGTNTVVNITGGIYDMGNQNNLNAGCAVWAKNGATVNIYDGEFYCNAIDGEVSSANHSDLIYAGADGGVVNIYGGFFKTATAGDWILNEKDNQGTITVYGGTFVNWNPANNVSESDSVSFLADGYTVYETVQANGDVWYTVVAE